MTDRFHTLTVVLEHDMRDDDAQALISAIGQLRGRRCLGLFKQKPAAPNGARVE